MGRTGGRGFQGAGRQLLEESWTPGKGRKVSEVWKGILEREGVLDGKCEVEVGSQNEMLIGMRKEAYLGDASFKGAGRGKTPSMEES